MSNHPPPQPHDPIEEIFEDVFWVHGSMAMGPGFRINRNMVVLRQAGELTVVNSVRLSAQGEAALDALGRVKHVVRIGQFHGLDDPYYVDRYGAEFWCQEGSDRYPEPKPTQVLDESASLPIDDAEVFVYRGTVHPECAILLRRDGGLLITCDSIQHWSDWSYCSLLGRVVGGLMGFRLTTFLGPPWRRIMTPKGGSLRPEFERLLQLDFDHHIGAHGTLCRGGAHQRVQAAVERAFAK